MAYGLMKRAHELMEEEHPNEPPLPEHLELHENIPELEDQEYSYYDQLSIELSSVWEQYEDDVSEYADSEDYSLIADKYDKW
jgi:hypothetical protein